jgi:hypothetical protein
MGIYSFEFDLKLFSFAIFLNPYSNHRVKMDSFVLQEIKITTALLRHIHSGPESKFKIKKN